jgi:cell wall-associated NlpC family hydrolase
MSIPSSRFKRLAITLPVTVVLGAGAISASAPGIASADNIQPAATSCVIQGSGTPCAMSQPDASASSAATPAEQSAVSWAQAQEGSTAWDNYCLKFVSDAYSQAGVDLSAQAGATDSAIDYWNTYTGTKNSPSESPPAGALVFWGATDSNPYGHVAISEGNGMAVSSYERSYTGVHELTIANRDSQGYAQVGWIMPG